MSAPSRRRQGGGAAGGRGAGAASPGGSKSVNRGRGRKEQHSSSRSSRAVQERARPTASGTRHTKRKRDGSESGEARRGAIAGETHLRDSRGGRQDVHVCGTTRSDGGRKQPPHDADAASDASDDAHDARDSADEVGQDGSASGADQGRQRKRQRTGDDNVSTSVTRAEPRPDHATWRNPTAPAADDDSGSATKDNHSTGDPTQATGGDADHSPHRHAIGTSHRRVHGVAAGAAGGADLNSLNPAAAVSAAATQAAAPEPAPPPERFEAGARAGGGPGGAVAAKVEHQETATGARAAGEAAAPRVQVGAAAADGIGGGPGGREKQHGAAEGAGGAGAGVGGHTGLAAMLRQRMGASGGKDVSHVTGWPFMAQPKMAASVAAAGMAPSVAAGMGAAAAGMGAAAVGMPSMAGGRMLHRLTTSGVAQMEARQQALLEMQMQARRAAASAPFLSPYAFVPAQGGPGATAHSLVAAIAAHRRHAAALNAAVAPSYIPMLVPLAPGMASTVPTAGRPAVVGGHAPVPPSAGAAGTNTSTTSVTAPPQPAATATMSAAVAATAAPAAPPFAFPPAAAGMYAMPSYQAALMQYAAAPNMLASLRATLLPSPHLAAYPRLMATAPQAPPAAMRPPVPSLSAPTTVATNPPPQVPEVVRRVAPTERRTSTKRRYRCRKCGQIKKGHNCPFA